MFCNKIEGFVYQTEKMEITLKKTFSLIPGLTTVLNSDLTSEKSLLHRLHDNSQVFILFCTVVLLLFEIT